MSFFILTVKNFVPEREIFIVCSIPFFGQIKITCIVIGKSYNRFKEMTTLKME